MKSALFTTIASLMTATVLTVSAADASVYTFNFESSDALLKAVGQITVDPSGEVVGISGNISGLVDQTINGVVANPNFPSAAYSRDGAFIYDNVFHNSNQPLDVDGILFTAGSGGGYWNLWGNSPTNYSLWESVPGRGYPIATGGALAVVGAPEPSTWILMTLGFMSLGYATLRRGARSMIAIAE